MIRSEKLPFMLLLLICSSIPIFSQIEARSIDSHDSDKSGNFTFKISSPLINYYHFKTDKNTENKFGFFGVGFGAELYVSSNISVNADFSVAPFLNPDNLKKIEFFGTYEEFSSIMLDFQIGTDYQGFHFDAGIHLWRITYKELLKNAGENQLGEKYDRLLYEFRQLYVGPALSVNHKLISKIDIALNYYLSLANWWADDTVIQYNHLIFLEMSLKL